MNKSIRHRPNDSDGILLAGRDPKARYAAHLALPVGDRFDCPQPQASPVPKYQQFGCELGSRDELDVCSRTINSERG
jgi:hypothetical protein